MRSPRLLTAFVAFALLAGCTRQAQHEPTPLALPQSRDPQGGERRLRVIGTNDFHGVLEPRPDDRGVLRGGAAAVAGAIAKARAECPPPACASIVLDGGDLFQGTPASNLAFGRPVVDVYNAIGYVAAALGNHEFDWGQDSLRARMRQAHFAMLGANIRGTDGRDVDWIRNDTLVAVGPYRVGVIGIATRETPSAAFPRNVAGLRFDDPAPIVDSIAASLRARGADAIILIAHAGAHCSADGSAGCLGEIVDVARRLTQKVDAIVSGHSHSLVNTEVAGIPIVQGRTRGVAFDVVDIPMSKTGGQATHEVRNVYSDSIAPVAAVQAIVARAVEAAGPLVNREIARISEDLPYERARSPLGSLIADAMRVEGRADVGVINAGGVRTTLRAGVATYGSLFEIQPFANRLMRVRVRGSDLRDYLERIVAARTPNAHVSGLTATFDPTAPPRSRLRSVTMRDGSPLADDREYTVVINDFMESGGDGLGFGDRAISTESLNLIDLDALIHYLRSLPQPVAGPWDVRLQAVR
jgi:2',3'-cyclic-nucleotide 2'-phosphodiesterase (5'-nucleotidase family)